MEVQEGQKLSPGEQEVLRWGEAMFEASYEVILPYTLAYGLDTPKPTLFLLDDSLFHNAFMAARCDANGNNLLGISCPRLKGMWDLFGRGRANKIYGCAYFFSAIAHELVHFSQYKYCSYDEVRSHEDRAWCEGTAHLLGWLIVSAIYRNSRNEPRFFYNSSDAMAKAVRAKRIRTGLVRYMAFFNYCFYLASLRNGFAYQPPNFLPVQTKKLYQAMVVAGGPTFATCGTEHWVEEIKKSTPGDETFPWAEWARGVMAGSRLLREKGFSPSALVANFISNDDVDKIIAGKA